jgi:type III secretion protein C
VETETKGRSGVPGLSRVPLVGGLFRVDDATSSRRERLFLLTPKVVGSVHSAVPVSAAPVLPAPVVAFVPVTAASTPPATVRPTATDLAAVREAFGLNGNTNTAPTAPVPAPAPARRVVTPAHAQGTAAERKAKADESKSAVKGVRL